MRFSLNFIKEFLAIEESSKKLAFLLTMAGMEVEAYEEKAGDWIFDIEVTTNRYDWLSMIGIAHEVSAVLGKKLNFNYPKISEKPKFSSPKIIIQDKIDCPYYLGRIITNLKVENSPSWLSEKIVNCGINSVNNIVDITNYSMLKWGHPLHAFDLDKVKGDIYIRRAKKQEVFLGIDGKERLLSQDNLVVCDSEKIIALAGVIGAKNTEVDEKTKKVFLEAAIFSPLTVRRSSRAVGLTTEASYRFERAVFPLHLECASFESAELFCKIAKGRLSGFQRMGKKPATPSKVQTISLDQLNFYLGTNVSKKEFKKCIESLGFNLKIISGKKIKVVVPSFRLDVSREVDIYEEFGRVYGYKKIPSSIPFLFCSNKGILQEVDYRFKNNLKTYIALLGFNEIITHSLEDSNEQIQRESKELIEIVNPLRKQENSMRTDLILGMVKSIKHNLNRGALGLSFFELADIYIRNKTKPSEYPVLALGVSGKYSEFFRLKKAVEEIFQYLSISEFNFCQRAFSNFKNSLEILSSKKSLGFIGKLNQEEAKKHNLKEDVFLAQIDVGLLFKLAKPKKYKSFSIYPPVYRDISVVGQGVQFKEIEEIIFKIGQHLKNLMIIDTYEGKDIPKGAKAFTLRIFYQAQGKTLTVQEVDSFHNDIRQKLKDQKGIDLR